MKILIIEDEPFAQNELKRLLKKTDAEIEVLACIDSIEESIEWFAENQHPDLVFLDIQLSDGLSFDIFKQVKVNSPVIFTTAYDEYAIQAFKLNSIDYLLKPIKLDALKKAIEKYEQFKLQFSTPAPAIDIKTIEKLLQGGTPQPDFKTRFMAKVGDQIKHIEVENIAYFYAEDKEVFVICIDKKRYIIEYTLEQLDKILDPKIFFRITRNYIVKISSVKKISKFFNSRLTIELEPPANDEIIISRVKANEFVKWIDK
jgi:DNA-binding LytR/AlgR family response regulator